MLGTFEDISSSTNLTGLLQAIVTMYNWQLYRHIDAPGWIMGWHWGKKENIANIIGGETREQGDCSKILGPIPHCCKPNPEVIDLLPGVPYNQQTANCCRGGVLSSYAQDPANSVASFQVIVGNSGFTNTTVILPKNFTLMTPGPGYTCGPAVKVPKTKFFTPDGRRVTLAFSKYPSSHSSSSVCISPMSLWSFSLGRGHSNGEVSPMFKVTSLYSSRLLAFVVSASNFGTLLSPKILVSVIFEHLNLLDASRF